MLIEIKVITNAKKREIKKEKDMLKVKICSPPVDGKANKELIEYLSEFYGVKRGDIKILKGEKDKKKLLYLPDFEKS